MQKLNIGKFVQIKAGYPMSGYIGIIKGFSIETRTYLIYFSQGQELSFPEEALEMKTA